jgi:hypothetical protein
VADLDTRLTRALEVIAEEGRTHSHGVPASVIRSTATRRQRRRYAAVGATTAVALIAGFGVLAGNPFGGDDTTRITGPATVTKPTEDTKPTAVSPLLTEQEVASSLGTTWKWTAGAVDTAPAKVTPCQAAPAADPARTSAQSRVVTGGWSGDDTLTELVEQSSSASAATGAYDRAVAWFTYCGGLGVDQSGAKNSLTKRTAARGAIAGVDQLRVVVRMREHLGTDKWTNTVAAVLRVGDRVAVIAWDTTMDDNPGAYDDGFVQLVQVAAARLTHSAAAVVPDDAMLSATDPSLVSLLKNPEVRLFIDTVKTPMTNLLCNEGRDPAAKGVIASRQAQIGAASGSAQPAGLTQSVRAHTSAAAASAAVQLARQIGQSCKPKIDGSVTDLPFAGGDESWARRFDGAGFSGGPSYTAVIRVGAGVSYMWILSLDTPVTDAEARAVFDDVVKRMTKVYG